MTIISRRIITPFVGKTELAMERAKKLAAIMARAGAGARVAKVITGQGAGDIEVFGRYSSFSAGTKAVEAMNVDPEFKSLRQQREKDQAAHLVGPHLYRTVYGELTAQPIIVQREYQISRANLKDALGLLPEVRAMFDNNTGIAAAVPVFAPEMDRLVVVYYSDSLESLGRVLDETGMSEAFQNVVTKAAEYGTLVAARVLAVV